jgi:hypothetical protein
LAVTRVDDPRYRQRRLGIAAIVAAVHGLLCWLLLSAESPLLLPAKLPDLEMIFILPPSPPTADAPNRSPANRSEGDGSRRQPPPRSASANPLQPPLLHDQDNAIHPPIDWDGELSRAAKDAVPASPSPPPRDFGIPHRTAPSAKAPEFAWDYARTHRVESIPSGGLLIHLSDRCVLVLTPLPLPFCRIGKRGPNGELFDHLHDLPPADE